MARSRKTNRNSQSNSSKTAKPSDVAEDAADAVTDAVSDTADAAEAAAKGVVEDAEFVDLPKEAEADVLSDLPETAKDAVEDATALAEDTLDAAETKAEGVLSETGEATVEVTDEATTTEPSDSDDMSSDDEPVVSDADPVTSNETMPEPVAIAAAPAPAERSALALALPLLFGGLIAGGIGFFAGRYYDDFNAPEVTGPTADDNAAALTEQTARLDGIDGSLQELAARDIAGEIGAAVAPVTTNMTDVTTRVDGLTAALSSLSERVETIALRPTATGIEAGEFDDALAEFRTQLQGTIDQAQSEIDKAKGEAEKISDQAFASEQAALVRSAWSQIETALESGAAYREPLDELQGMVDKPVPEPLSASADDGIPQLASLQQDFAGAARDALDASIRTASNEGSTADRITSFLRVQSGVRSLAPRDGDDPDAVLSRAEAALKSGDVEGTLGEIEALPEAGKAALSDWVSAATTRLDVLGAASDFASTLQ